MSANFNLFSTQFPNYLKSNVAQSESDVANMLATLYVSSLSTATVTTSSALIIPLIRNNIAKGFEQSMKLAKNIKTGSPDIILWQPAAASIIAEFSTLKINPLPPIAPITVPTSGYTITNPGSVTSLMKDISVAFASKDPQICSNILVNGFIKHLSSVSGVYVGMVPSPTGLIVVPPIPWSGIS